MFWFIVFLLMLGAVFYMYQNLKTMEKEIREEQQREKDSADQQKSLNPEPASAAKVAVAEPVAEVSKAEVEPGSALKAEAAIAESDNEIISLIRTNPGIKQTELYAKVETMSTKQAQQMLKKMADAGEIKREKAGSSYKLYV